MNLVFIEKLKRALKTKHPIEAINEIITEYEELIRLASWRQSILLSGKSLKKHQKELDRIANLLEENGLFECIGEQDLDKEVRKYFNKKL